MSFSIPEGLFPISGLAPTVGAAGTVTSDYISLKNAQMCWVVIHYNQGDGDAQTWIVNKATAVAPTGATAITNVVPIYSCLDTATSGTFVKRTSAVEYASGTGATNKVIVFQIDPADLGSTYDCIAAGSSSNIAATSYVSIMFYVQPRYADLDIAYITD